MPAHHNAEDYLDAYLNAADIWEQKPPLFRSINRYLKITENPMLRADVWAMIKRRVKDCGALSHHQLPHLPGPGITAYLENGGTIENAQSIAAHE